MKPYSKFTDTAQIRRPHTTIVLAMSADGKIADRDRSPARFGSPTDKAHLERQLAQADAVLFGAGTLRAYGTTLRIRDPQLLEERQQRGQPPQPVQIVCSRSAQFDLSLPFFQQPVPRWLLTLPAAAQSWQSQPAFDRILTAQPWTEALAQLTAEGIDRLAITGGGEVTAALVEADLVDELWFTVCPLLLGGETAPTPVSGAGFAAALAPRLRLLSAEAIDQEVFLHYACLPRSTPPVSPP